MVYDLKNFEANLRASIEGVSVPEGSPEWHKCQHRGDEVHVQLALWIVGETNRGTEARDIYTALANMLGTALFNMTSGTDPDDRAVVFEWFANRMVSVFEDILNGHVIQTPGAKMPKAPN